MIERIMKDYMGRPVYRQDVDRNEVSPIFFLEIYIFISTLIVVLGLFWTFPLVFGIERKNYFRMLSK